MHVLQFVRVFINTIGCHDSVISVLHGGGHESACRVV